MFATSSWLHVANLTGLVWLRTQCRDSIEGATGLCDIDEQAALFYRELSDGAMEALCSELDVSLFVPRSDSTSLPGALAARDGGPGGRPADLEIHNLGQMQALCDACHRSIGEAAWIYRIDRETAEAYRALTHDLVVRLCKALKVCALLPRYSAVEAARILDKPPGSRALFAAAYETDIAVASEAARRGVYLTH